MEHFLVDAHLLIWVLRGKFFAAELLNSLAERGEIHITSLTYMEVLRGIDPEDENRALKLMSRFDTTVIDEKIADRAARLMREYWSKGYLIDFFDAALLATAITKNYSFVTYNVERYPRVMGLDLFPIMSWAVT